MSDIPRAPGAPLVGNLRGFTSDLQQFLTAQYLALGPVFRVSALNQSYVVLAGVEANEFMMRKGIDHFVSQDIWDGSTKALGGQNPSVASLDGPDHATMRRGLKPGYAAAPLYARMVRLVGCQLDLLRQWPRARPLAVFPHVKRLVAMLLGYMATNESAEDVMDDFIYLLKAMVQIHVFKTRPAFMQHLPRYTRSRQAVLDLSRRLWLDSEGAGMVPEDGNFVAVVRRFHEEHPELMNERDAMAALNGPFIAGLDTAASTISFLLYHILADPDLTTAAIEEADAAFADGVPNRNSLRSMIRVRRAAMETLRLYPPAPVMIRDVSRGFRFAGFDIPAGTRCMLAFTVTHGLPELFKDPDRFDPERFGPERQEHMQPHAYAPYGLGPHVCLGASTADLLFLIVTAVLFRHYDVAMDPPGHKVRMKMQPLPSPDNRFRLILQSVRRPEPEWLLPPRPAGAP